MQLPYSNLQLKHHNPGAEQPLVLPIHVICNTSDEQLFDNIRLNARRPGAWVKATPAHERVAVLCGSGPSLADTVEDIRERHAHGAVVFAMNGAAAFLHRHGILPDYQVIIDARAETAQLVGPARQHLFASQVHPACFARQPAAQVWHLQITGIDEVLPDYDEDYCLIGGAASVGNTAACLAYALGYRTLHLYGYDSSHRDGQGHAFSQPMNNGDPCAMVRFCGKDYLTSLTMKLQAEKFQLTARDLTQLGCTLHVHGSGLLPDMYNTPKEALTEQQKYERMWTMQAYRTHAPGETCVDAFLALAPERGTVLDIGCGTGRGGLRLKEAGYAVTLVDFTENSRDYEALVLPFVQHDLTQPFPRTARYGYCTDVLEHIPTPDVPTVLRHIVAATEQAFFQISTEPDQLGALINQELHLTVQPLDWWVQQLQDAGATVLQATPVDGGIQVWTQHVRQEQSVKVAA